MSLTGIEMFDFQRNSCTIKSPNKPIQIIIYCISTELYFRLYKYASKHIRCHDWRVIIHFTFIWKTFFWHWCQPNRNKKYSRHWCQRWPERKAKTNGNDFDILWIFELRLHSIDLDLWAFDSIYRFVNFIMKYENAFNLFLKYIVLQCKWYIKQQCVPLFKHYYC